MKQEKHENRKSFAKWALPDQRTMTRDMEKLEFRRDVAVMKMRPATNIGKNNGKRSSESQIQERANAPAWFVFHAVALWASASRWYRLKRICAWHEPRPIRMGGNPFAKQVTHGLCPECFARVSGEIAGHEPEPDASRTGKVCVNFTN